MMLAHGDAATSRWQAGIDRLLGWRDRLLASPRFQRRAAAFALTRPVARRHARELFDLVAGFVYSQVLLACVRLRLFDILAEGPQTPDQLAARLALQPEATRRLLAAAVALRLVQRRSGGRFGLGELGAPMVGNAAVASMVEHHAALYADLADPVALLRGSGSGGARANALARYWPYADSVEPGAASSDRVAEYSTLMSASQPLVADEILDAYPLHRHHVLLDVGGGEGTFLMAVAPRAPRLQLQLFDLPAVAERARTRFAGAGLGERATAFGGSFLTDALPTGADIVTLVRVVHDHDDTEAMALLCAVHCALPAGGTLLLAEPMAGTPGAQAMGDAYFGFYLLAMGSGRPRSAPELIRMLRAAGFDAVRLLRTRQPLQTRVLVATATGRNPKASAVNCN
jgi:demethylspheroidene O-methyltransferase